MKEIDTTVLWIDDECHEDINKDLIKYAEKNNITLIPCQYGDEGIRKLRHKFTRFDAILLDARLKYREKDNDDIKNLFTLKENIKMLFGEKGKTLPVFILTGKEVDRLKDLNWDIYDKDDVTFDESESNLWTDIIKSVKDHPINIIKNNYNDVISAGSFIDKCIEERPSETEQQILQLALHIENTRLLSNPFDTIRLTLDDLFICLSKIEESFPKEIISNKKSPSLGFARDYYGFNNLDKDYYKRLELKKNKVLKDFKKKLSNLPPPIENKNPWPHDISTILKVLLHKSSPVQGFNHKQTTNKTDDNHLFDNLRSPQIYKYATRAYVNHLFCLLIWFNKEYSSK